MILIQFSWSAENLSGIRPILCRFQYVFKAKKFHRLTFFCSKKFHLVDLIRWRNLNALRFKAHSVVSQSVVDGQTKPREI